MGIKYLNRFLKKNCNKGIGYIHIDTLRGKTIVVDTSIYMYKFLEDDALVENFFIMITHFREYNITPLFIFDGKADASKMELLWKRVINKRCAMKEFDKLKSLLDDEVDANESNKKKLTQKMEICRKNSIRIKERDIRVLKELFDAMGVFYFVAQTEADVVCAYFVKKGLAWACMSDDMDMFVYGCDFILREWNVITNTGILYDRNQIMKEVWVEPEYFSQLLLLLGSDYHQDVCKNECIHIDTAFIWYDEFMKNIIMKSVLPISKFSFYNWLQNTNNITLENSKKLETIWGMYVIPDNIDTNFMKTKNSIDWTALQKLMAPHGFII